MKKLHKLNRYKSDFPILQSGVRVRVEARVKVKKTPLNITIRKEHTNYQNMIIACNLERQLFEMILDLEVKTEKLRKVLNQRL